MWSSILGVFLSSSLYLVFEAGTLTEPRLCWFSKLSDHQALEISLSRILRSGITVMHCTRLYVSAEDTNPNPKACTGGTWLRPLSLSPTPTLFLQASIHLPPKNAVSSVFPGIENVTIVLHTTKAEIPLTIKRITLIAKLVNVRDVKMWKEHIGVEGAVLWWCWCENRGR